MKPLATMPNGAVCYTQDEIKRQTRIIRRAESGAGDKRKVELKRRRGNASREA